MSSLESYPDILSRAHGEIEAQLNTPLSVLVPSEFDEFIDQQKNRLKMCDSDLKDAKRRITASKGPRKSQQTGSNPADFESSGSETA